jgi:MFS transporter, MHS family, citrate/tricarballylate:H+ symporter
MSSVSQIHTIQPAQSKVGAILRVTSGNFLEMYDFFAYGLYAAAIGNTFFPGDDPTASLLKSYATFGAGFLMRPLGAIVLGAYIDRIGRRKGLILTLALMAIGTLLIAIVPGYRSIGVAAPVLVLFGRLIQGFSAGVELGGVSVYLSEIAPPGRKGFYVSWQSASQQVAIIFAALLGITISSYLTPKDLGDWGWRIPFVIGCMIVPFIFIIRRSLQETEEFLAKKHRPSVSEILTSMASNWAIVVAGGLMVVMTTVFFYGITIYTVEYGRGVLGLTALDSFIVTALVALSNLFWLPVMGAVSDRVGRKPILVIFTVLAILTSYPALSWLVGSTSFSHLLLVELWFSFLYGSYNGAMVVALTEIMPVDVRTAGFSLAYSLATAIFGGFTPAVATYLIEATNNKAAPGLWLTFAAVCGLGATLFIYAQKRHGGTAGARFARLEA